MRYWFLICIVLIVGLVIGASTLIYWISGISPAYYFSSHAPRETLFEVQAIDTMKYSRDMARGQAGNLGFDATINQQMQLIADAGATHVAIATPYDAEFLPYLTRWVASARAHNLSVWFRGNFSGWEGWFEYERIDRTEHKAKLVEFIAQNQDLFKDGDIFTPCPECENGGPGDPRQTGDAVGFNAFLIEEKDIAERQFIRQHKKVDIYYSMNGDIAREIITPATARRLGGTVLVDHYTRTSAQFAKDITMLGSRAKTSIGFGEFGAPIPDLQGSLSDTQQATFVYELLHALYLNQDSVRIVNYWTLAGGSTEIIRTSGAPKAAYRVVQDFYRAPSVYGNVHNSLGEPLEAHVSLEGIEHPFKTKGSFFQVFLPKKYRTVTISAEGYMPQTIVMDEGFASSTRRDIYLEPTAPSAGYRLREIIGRYVYTKE